MAVCSLTAAAQQFVHLDDKAAKPIMPDLSVTHSLPTLEPSSALLAFLRHSVDQNSHLAGYRDETTVTAELPDTKQRGEYQLERTYTAQPKTLSFSNARFSGDGFVKTNVITRLLQSEVDHVERGNPDDTALTSANYRFYYKGMEAVEGHDYHVYQVKPRRKNAGLFKGRIYLDVHNGNLRRMEGQLSKAPSFFIKDVEFTQNFDDVDGFTFPTELHSRAKARIIGRVVATVVHKSYQVTKSVVAQNAVSEMPSVQLEQGGK